MIFGKNPNKDYRQRGTIEGGVINTYKQNPGAIGAISIRKAKSGKRAFTYNHDQYYEKEAGSGEFYKHTGNGRLTVSDYDPNPKPEPAPAPKPSGGGGGGSSRPSGSTASYGTTAPSYGNTGNAGLDASTMALMEMVKSLTATLAETKKVDTAEISKPAGEGLGSTVLSQTYVPSKEKKKKSYLTPISVG